MGARELWRAGQEPAAGARPAWRRAGVDTGAPPSGAAQRSRRNPAPGRDGAQWDDTQLDRHLRLGDQAADQAILALVALTPPQPGAASAPSRHAVGGMAAHAARPRPGHTDSSVAGGIPGDATGGSGDSVARATAAAMPAGVTALHQVLGMLRPLTDNGALAAMRATPGAPLAPALAACDALPPWAEPEKIARAEQLFREGGVMSCVLFFCASLPEVYAAPDIASLLHVTGNLEQATDQRIRATSAMILSVLMPGGLSKPGGAGRSKVLKARLVHAAMRHLFLRGDPRALAGDPAVMPPLEQRTGAPPFERAWRHGWNVARDGVPCNQEEQSYTLLTFGYVYLRSLRRLGLGLPAADELAYLHLWNVVGSLLGVGDALLAHTMDDAQRLFARLRQRAGARLQGRDTRPLLGGALVDTIEKSVAHPWLRPACALLVRHLCSDATARQLGLHQRYSWPARLLFGAALATLRLADKGVRAVHPGFSLVRFALRIAGYRLVHAVLTDMRNPIDLPDAVRQEVNAMLDEWSTDRHAPAWLNRVERYFTTRQQWRVSIGV